MNMKKMMWVFIGMLFLVTSPAGAEIVTFDDLDLDPESFYNGSDEAGEFETTGVVFNIFYVYDDEFGPYWEGFAYSNTTDTTTPGFTNQYSAITGSGANASSNYGVGYVDGFYDTIPTITFTDEVTLAETYITNTTYAFLAMQDGERPAKKFGGDTGDDPDWYLLTITGKDVDENPTGVIEFYLADFRFDDNYIIDAWTAVDLSGLGQVKTVEFSVTSSDTGDFGINTPTYFAIDSIAIDQCPDDPDKIDPGVCGCGVSDCEESDDDNDNGGNDATCFIRSLGR
jgi:hypothetical protein